MKLRSLAFLTAAFASALLATTTTPVLAKDPPPYACETDADCEEKFPDTVCITVDQYGDITKKCTPNTKERPACRGATPGLCPSYQASEIGYLNAHCVFVPKDQPGAGVVKPASSKSGSGSAASARRRERYLMLEATGSKAGSKGSGAEVTVPSGDGSGKSTTTPAEKIGDFVKVKIGNDTVTGFFKCVDISDCENQAYDPSTCEPKECGSPGSKEQCSNRGTCTFPSIQTMKRRQCMCYKGFSGDKCQKEESNECDVDCGIGGDCIDGECKCKKGYDGKAYKGKKGKPNARCSACTNDLACQNGNACDIETGKCVCGPGFKGPTCGATEDSCTMKSCGETGICRVLGNGSSACYCPLCAPDCELCKTKDCSTCPSTATTASVSKLAVFVSAMAALLIGNLIA
ncbi:hypothetical protein P43SY_004899 [Pythium insidiosum]|uniref:EGF-like domain-containing protein n=1 Tax=Pythium insidiosum TaxID=114742 RepID=A0AAD5Q8T6_PYTIN|nr:hypothetical protein P43SY_004899 [Pythium insidiosum]